MARRQRGLWLALLWLVLLLAGCTGQTTAGGQAGGEASQQSLPGGSTLTDGAEIALLITEQQKLDDFGQGVISTVSRFAGEQGISYGAYTVDSADTDATLATIELAVKGSAVMLISMGDEMAAVVERAQVLYPDLQFIVLNTSYQPTLRSNTLLVEFDELQAGWLAGYAAVLQGYRLLAVIEQPPAAEVEPPESDTTSEAASAQSTPPQEAASAQSNTEAAAGTAAVPQGDTQAVTAQASTAQLRNTGFVLGAEACAQALNLQEGSVTVAVWQNNYQTAALRRQALSELYAEGVEMLFVASEGDQSDAWRAANAAGGGLISVEMPALYLSGEGFASVGRSPAQPLASLLAQWYVGSLPADKTVFCGLAEAGYTLATTGFDRFTTYVQEQIAALFAASGYVQTLYADITSESGTLLELPALALTYTVVSPGAFIDNDSFWLFNSGTTGQQATTPAQAEAQSGAEAAADETPADTAATQDENAQSVDASVAEGADTADTAGAGDTSVATTG